MDEVKYKHSDLMASAPVRYAMADMETFWKEAMSERLYTLKAVLQDESMTVQEAKLVMSDDNTFRQMVQAMGMDVTSTNDGMLTNFLLYLRWLWSDAPMFQLDDDLNTMLVETDIAANCPCKFFRLPYPQMYIEFGTKRDMDITVDLSPGDKYPIEGVFISERKTSPKQLNMIERAKNDLKIDDKDVRYFEMSFTGSPVGREHVLDDAVNTVPIFVTDEEESVSEMVERHLTYMMSVRKGVTPLNDEHKAFFESALMHVTKALLYLNSSETRTENSFERTRLMKRISEAKSKGKRAKLERRAARAIDKVIVSAPGVTKGVSSLGGTVSAHWRRGHFRNQAYGEGRSKHKIIWIMPTLIGAGDVNVKDYQVK